VGEKFSAPIQTGPEAHPDLYSMGTRSFLGIKRPGCDVDHPPPSRAEVKERVELYLCAFMDCSRVNFTVISVLLEDATRSSGNKLE
jgi:hypothetical protein